MVAACSGANFGSCFDVRLELAVCLLLAGYFAFLVRFSASTVAHFEMLLHVASWPHLHLKFVALCLSL